MSDERVSEPPSARDINPHGSLDEVVAADHFLHKSLEEAEMLFREDSALYQEDLMWMGPRAFAYYLPAAIQYVKSEAAAGDVEFIAALLAIVRFRQEEEEFSLATRAVKDLVSYVTRHINRFEIDGEDCADLLADYQQLREELGD